MQVPPVAGSPGWGKTGYALVLISSILVAIAFFVLPVVATTSSYGGYGVDQSQTANTFLQAAQTYGSYGTSGGTPSAYSTVYSGIIWAILGFAVVCGVLSIIYLIRPASRGAAVSSGISFIIMSMMEVTVVGLIVLGIAATSLGSVGAGGWVCFLGMLAIVIGGIMVVAASSASVDRYAYAPVSPQQPPSANHVQYPLNSSSPQLPQYPQQPSSPNYPLQQPPQW